MTKPRLLDPEQRDAVYDIAVEAACEASFDLIDWMYEEFKAALRRELDDISEEAKPADA